MKHVKSAFSLVNLAFTLASLVSIDRDSAGGWCISVHTSRDVRIPTPIIARACAASLKGPSTAAARTG